MFGLGIGELVLALVILCAPVAALFVGGRALLRAIAQRNAPPELEARRMNAELDGTRMRIEELEAKLARVDEKATFVENLLEKPRDPRST